MRHLSVVTGAPVADAQPVAYVPVKLLLAVSGRCSCGDCCRAAVADAEVAPAPPPRPSRGTDRQPVRNVHLLS